MIDHHEGTLLRLKLYLFNLERYNLHLFTYTFTGLQHGMQELINLKHADTAAVFNSE